MEQLNSIPQTMDPTVMKFVISISGVFILFLIGMIGYLVKQILHDQKVINVALTESINSLNLTMVEVKLSLHSFDERCRERHKR